MILISQSQYLKLIKGKVTQEIEVCNKEEDARSGKISKGNSCKQDNYIEIIRWKCQLKSS